MNSRLCLRTFRAAGLLIIVSGAIKGQTTFEFDDKHLAAIRVGGVNVLTGGGSYLIASASGVDSPETNHSSNGSSGGRLSGGGPPFKLTFRRSGDEKLAVTIQIGPMPKALNSLNFTLDFDSRLASSLAFPAKGYRLGCTYSDGPKSGSSLKFDDISQRCEIKQGGVVIGKVGSAIVDDPNLPWIEFDGPLASVRVNRLAAVGTKRAAFFNHFGAHAGQYEFGPVNQGGTVSFEGEIVVTAKTSGVVKRFEAERDLQHQVGRAEADGWSANVLDVPNRFLCYGPYTSSIALGSRTATFNLLLDNVTADNRQILTLDVYDSVQNKILASLAVTRKMFSSAYRYQQFSLPFTASGSQRLEFRTYWHGFSYVREDRVEIR